MGTHFEVHGFARESLDELAWKRCWPFAEEGDSKVPDSRLGEFRVQGLRSNQA